MRQFLAILKDSFREAVDGFVIYLMLILSALLIVLIGSISYAPDSPSDAIPRILGESQSTMFKAIFPDRGRSAAPTGSSMASLPPTNRGPKRHGCMFLRTCVTRSPLSTWTTSSGMRMNHI